VANGSSRRVTSGQRAVAAAALVDQGRLSVAEAAVWADALAMLVDDGQEDGPVVLLSRVVDRSDRGEGPTGARGPSGARGGPAGGGGGGGLPDRCGGAGGRGAVLGGDRGRRSGRPASVRQAHPRPGRGRAGGWGVVATDHCHDVPGDRSSGRRATGSRIERPATSRLRSAGASNRRGAHRRRRSGRPGELVTWPTEEDRVYAAEVGRRLRGWRVMRRLTQQQTAERAGVDRVVVIAAELGAVALDLTRLRRLAWALGAPLPELVDKDSIPPRAAGSHSGPAPRRR